MDREQKANEIELFCNTAPDNTYLGRFNPSPNIDTFIWLRGSGPYSNVIPETIDLFAHKGHEGHIAGIGRFRRYLTRQGYFDKALYVNPDN